MLLSSSLSSLCHPRSLATKLSSSPLYALPLGPAHSSFQVQQQQQQQQQRLSFELAALLVANLGLGSLASVSSPAATACNLLSLLHWSPCIELGVTRLKLVVQPTAGGNRGQ